MKKEFMQIPKRETYKEFRKSHGVHFSDRMTAKLEGVLTLSTSVKENPFCDCRHNIPGAICKDCFAVATLNKYSDLETLLTKNFEILNSVIIPVEEWPLIPFAVCRFEAFGDPATVTCVLNYINCVAANPHVRFALWSKNVGILKNAFSVPGVKKPKNLQIVGSSLYVNKIDERLLNYWFIDRVFTVFTADYAIENNIKINCGFRRCLECLVCYKKNNVKYVNEILKKDQKRYYKMLSEKKGGTKK